MEKKFCEVHVKGFTGDSVRVILMDDSGKVRSEERPTTFEEDYPLINVSEIFSSPCIYGHIPQSEEEKRLKTSLEIAKTLNMQNFRYSAKTPENIVRDPEWWYYNLETINPSKKSRMGLQFQYDLYLAMRIKDMVEHGVEEDEAWDEVCTFNPENQKFYLRKNEYYGFVIANGNKSRYFKYRYMRADEHEHTIGWCVMDE